ncbi:MAG: hypothetical protein KKB91_11880 [Proteobacteria bacterium]|nr:hypothetical protein [Desulfocapsa sp.]MBU3945966.1 hypothetical protein [Pseudomonadota bacterium]MCG2743324.1 hypothetical protein [Desulfobacteraceae bacterium]MBU4028074.1 hypothetical protein [Pseudomonadota bacterium]MBU4042976.1 hypothetical protein [Pseudomonadota bacterium]
MKKTMARLSCSKTTQNSYRTPCYSPDRRTKSGTILLIALLLFVPATGYSFDFGSMVDDVGSAVKSGVKTIERSADQILQKGDKRAVKKQQIENTAKSEPQETIKQSTADNNSKSQHVKTKSASPPVNSGGSIFSKDPINPDNPSAPVASFTAGDHIYGMLKASKPWKELNQNSNYIIVWLYIDGQQKVYKSVGLQRPELIAQDYFIIDVAPEPSHMSNYSDRDIIFPEKDGYKFGPELFTKYLSELPPGEHTFRLEVKAYNKIYASGEFSISGDDFSSYSKLLAGIKDSSGQQQKMPKVGKVDMALQNEMIALLKNGGWPDIRRLVIVDKDWWIDRVAGGDSAVESRHMEAAAAAQDTDGSFYFRHVTFHQPMLITGNWGKLELSNTGEKKALPEANVDK